jgi:hypothetical protein
MKIGAVASGLMGVSGELGVVEGMDDGMDEPVDGKPGLLPVMGEPVPVL